MQISLVNMSVGSLGSIWTAGAHASSFCLIAGGVCRDMYFGVPSKDIDVFVGPDFDPQTFQCHLNLAKFEASHDEEKVAQYQGYFGKSMQAVWAAVRKGRDTREIQIMQWRESPSFEQVLAGFDYDFCQIGFNGASMHASDAFFGAARTFTATCLLAPDDERTPSSRMRAERFKSRYPAWDFVVPQDGGLLHAANEAKRDVDWFTTDGVHKFSIAQVADDKPCKCRSMDECCSIRGLDNEGNACAADKKKLPRTNITRPAAWWMSRQVYHK